MKYGFPNNFITLMKYNRKKYKHHEPAAPINNIVYQNQCQTEVQIRQKNIEKLIFVESDDQDLPTAPLSQLQPPTSSREYHRNHDLSLNRRRPLNNPFNPATTILKPSFMQATSDYQSDYESIPNCESAVVAGRKKKTILSEKRNTMVVKNDNFFDELVTERDRLREQKLAFKLSEVERKDRKAKPAKKGTVHREQSKIGAFEQKEMEKGEQKQEHIEIRKLGITNLCFQISDEEGEKPQEPQTEPTPPTTTQSKLDQILNQKEEGLSQSLNDQHEQAIKAHYPEQMKELKVDITSTELDRQLEHRSLYLENYIKSSPSSQELVSCMLTPIYGNTRQIFEVHIYSSFSQKEYFLWLNMGLEMRLLMKAKKSIRLNKSSFELTTYNSQVQQYVQTAYLESNLQRSKFNIIKYDRYSSKKRILGTIVNSVNINHSKLIVMYYPQVDSNNYPTVFNIDRNSIDLQQVYRQNEIQLVDFMMTTRIDMTKRLKMMSAYELRASGKSMQFKDQKGNISMMIGKRASKRYKIVVGGGLTPVQIFSMLIVQVET